MSETPQYTPEQADAIMGLAHEVNLAHDDLQGAFEGEVRARYRPDLKRLTFVYDEQDKQEIIERAMQAQAQLVLAHSLMPNFVDLDLPSPFSPELDQTSSPAETLQSVEVNLYTDTKVFVDSEEPLDIHWQVSLWNEFYKSVSEAMPELTPGLIEGIAARLEANPTNRIVIAPLANTMDDRSRLVDNTRLSFPNQQQFTDNGSPLWRPDSTWHYGKLLDGLGEDVDTVVTVDDKLYKLGYKTAEGEIVGRNEYVQSLLSSGDAIQAEDGTIWTVSVVEDLSPRSERTPRTKAQEIHKELVSHVNTPESMIAMLMLHQVSGERDSLWQPDFVNEAVYEVDENGDFLTETDAGGNQVMRAPVIVAGVYWNPDYRQVNLSSWDGDNSNGGFGARAAESVLTLKI